MNFWEANEKRGKRLLKVIILAAGFGRRLKELFEHPKCLLKIGKQTLIERYLKALTKNGIREIIIVVGYKQEEIISFVKELSLPLKIKFIENLDFKKGSILSLWKAKEELKGNVLLMDADVYFEEEVLKRLINSKKNNLLLIDATSKGEGEEVLVGIKDNFVIDLARDLGKKNFDLIGEWIGFLKIDDKGSKCLKKIVEQKIKDEKFDLGYEDVLPEILKELQVNYELVNGLKWVEIDFPEDVKQADYLNKLEKGYLE